MSEDLRDQLAITCPITLSDAYHHWDSTLDLGKPKLSEIMKYWAKMRYEYADKMLEARNE